MVRSLLISALFLLLAPVLSGAPGFQLPATTTQCVVGTAAGWNSSQATLSYYEKTDGTWKQVGPSWPARLGRDGLIWGSGMHPVPAGAATKREGDWRSPAGVFAIGGVWGYQAAIRKHPRLFYHKITPQDLWVEDAASPNYNRHVMLDHEAATPWEKKQQMKQNDPAHALKLFIAHNAPPNVVPGAGSSIFFHIWRADGGKPTAGCTTMSEAQLRWLIARLDPSRKPAYVLLTKADYTARRAEWKLP